MGSFQGKMDTKYVMVTYYYLRLLGFDIWVGIPEPIVMLAERWGIN